MFPLAPSMNVQKEYLQGMVSVSRVLMTLITNQTDQFTTLIQRRVIRHTVLWEDVSLVMISTDTDV